MSYEGEDKWDFYLSLISETAPNIFVLRKVIADCIRQAEVGRMINSMTREEWEIVNVRFSLRRKHGPENI